VVLRVPREERGKVGLVYGPIRFVRSIEEASKQVTFRPCADKPRTVWPGGLALASLQPITLEVLVGGRKRTLRLR
jgi:hypothetical protein